MNYQEGLDDSGEATYQAFQNVMNILDEEGMIADMLFPQRKEGESQKQENQPEWRQWAHDDFNKQDTVPLISIQEDRKFLFDDKHRHMWYKNINLPTITVSVQHESFAGGKYGIILDCFGVQISEEQMQNSSSSKDCPTPQFVGGYKRFSLEGEGIQQTILSQKSQHIFQRIKCKETSYNNKGLRFYIMLYIYEIESNKPILIRLSPSLYIESRKKSFQETLGFSHPFMPETLTKVYAKCSQLINQESIESFCEYYSSCSIRHKQGSTSLFFEIQCQIYNQIHKDLLQKNPNGDDNKNLKPKVHKSSLFPLLGIIVNYEGMPPHDKKQEKKIYQKVHRFVKPLVGSILQVYFERKDIPNCMKEIAYKEHMKDDYKSIYHQLAELKVKKSQSLGPSNTQYTHPHHQQSYQGNSSNNQYDEYSSNDSDSQVNHKKSDKRNSIVTQEIRYKNKSNQESLDDSLLKKRPYNSLMVQRCKISTTSGGEQNGNYNELEDEDDIDMENHKQQGRYISKQKGETAMMQQPNNHGSIIFIQKSKKLSDTTNTRNSFYSNENSDDDEQYDLAHLKNAVSRMHSRKETLCKIPEIPSLSNNKENSTTNPTPQTSFPEYNSQTTIYPDQTHSIPSMPFVHQVYQVPQSMMMPFQNPYGQPMLIPINNFMPHPNVAASAVPNPTVVPIQHAATTSAALGHQGAVQVVMNPFPMQNMYYPYPHGGFMPMPHMQAQHQLMAATSASPFMQPSLINFSNPTQPISIQPNSQYFQQPKITETTPLQQQQQPQSQQQQEKC